MENLINGLYTQFVLRDFLGRVVPGAVLLLLVSLAFAEPADIKTELKDLNSASIAFIAGVAWIAATGLHRCAPGPRSPQSFSPSRAARRSRARRGSHSTAWCA